MGEIRVGISGWTYAGWRGDFYPQGLAHRRELAYDDLATSRSAAAELDTWAAR